MWKKELRLLSSRPYPKPSITCRFLLPHLNTLRFYAFPVYRLILGTKQVWRLWDEGKGEALIDQNIVDTCPVSEALRWIHIALLCVQEDPKDRPSISTVILMLGSKKADLPQPSAPPAVGKFFMSDQSSTTEAGTGFLTSDQAIIAR